MKNYCSLFLIGLFVQLGAAEPAARFEIASLPVVSAQVSRLENCIAPRFRDSVAAATLILTMGAAQLGMDLTRPWEISFYSFGENPSVRITAFSLGDGELFRKSAKLLGVHFQANRQRGLVVLDSEGLKEPFPADPPGLGLRTAELIRGSIQAEAVHRHFRFRSFNTGDDTARLILGGVDELLAQLTRADVVFSADEAFLKLNLSVVPRKQSALQKWMAQPLPPKGKIETYPGAKTLSVLRLNPTETLRQYGMLYLAQTGRKNSSPAAWAESATGFAAMASGRENLRLSAGIIPNRAETVRKTVRQYRETPFAGWFSLAADPVLLCFPAADRIIFFGTSRMDAANLQAMSEPQAYRGALPDCPFVCMDLSRPEKPLAQLLFDKGLLRLKLQAPDEWFASCGPLLSKPLLLPDDRRKKNKLR